MVLISNLKLLTDETSKTNPSSSASNVNPAVPKPAITNSIAVPSSGGSSASASSSTKAPSASSSSTNTSSNANFASADVGLLANKHYLAWSGVTVCQVDSLTLTLKNPNVHVDLRVSLEIRMNASPDDQNQQPATAFWIPTGEASS